MRATARLRRALSSASLLLLGGGAVLLGSCGGGGMDATSMSAPAVMATGSMGMSCSMMDMSSMGCPAPGITMMAPMSPVNRSVTLSATVTGASAGMVMQVVFLVDGVDAGTATRVPYSVTWDSTTVKDGAHTVRAQVTDSMDRTVTSSPVSVQVDNNPTFTVTLTPAQLVPAPASGAAGSATLNARLADGTVGGKIMLSGVTATTVSINSGFAGDSGSPLVTLTASSGGEWDVPTGAMLTADQVSALMRGGLYVVATSSAHPAGEVRGQILPANVMVTFSPMAGTQEVPPVSTAASGIAVTTVDAAANTLTMHVHTTGVGDAMAGEVDTGSMGTTGSLLATLGKDSVDPGHWSAELVAINAGDVANFDAADWYVNVATPTDPTGAIRGQIAAPTH